MALFPGGYFAPHFVEEVFEEDDVVLCLLRSFGLGGGYQRRDALAVGREIDILAPSASLRAALSDHIRGLSATKESPFTVYAATMICSSNVSKNRLVSVARPHRVRRRRCSRFAICRPCPGRPAHKSGWSPTHRKNRPSTARPEKSRGSLARRGLQENLRLPGTQSRAIALQRHGP